MTPMSGGHAHAHGAGVPLDVVVLALAALAVASYAAGAIASRRGGRPWPMHRMVLWCVGIAVATAPVVEPLASTVHGSFVGHAWGHVVGGMLAPILLVLAAPVALALRTLAVTPARRLSRLLRSAPVRVLAHPVTAALLSSGGLWLIHLTPLHEAMQASPFVHVVVHAHTVAAGYLFTAALIGVDPNPHPSRWTTRAIVLVLAMASHAVLAKLLYAHPPGATSVADERLGALTMYYAGGVVELGLAMLLCARWYRESGRRVAIGAADRLSRARPSPAARTAGSRRR